MCLLKVLNYTEPLILLCVFYVVLMSEILLALNNVVYVIKNSSRERVCPEGTMV